MNAEETVAAAWRDLARRQKCDAGLAAAVLGEVASAYAQAHRHYHTLDHVAEVLGLLERLGGAADGDAIQLALIFHDVVYDTARHDNEAASAVFAAERLTWLGYPASVIAKVERYIRATQHGSFSPVTDDPDLCLLLDLDLAILGAPAGRYDAYAQAIRREYARVPDSLYRPGRQRFLKGFLDRERIYLTDRLRALWEASARVNLAREISQLA